MAAAKFKVGDKVNYPACPDGSFGAGVGTVCRVTGGVVRVKNAGGTELNHDFTDADLSAA